MDNPILGVTLRVTLRLLPRFTVDSTMQGGEGKGGKQYTVLNKKKVFQNKGFFGKNPLF